MFDTKQIDSQTKQCIKHIMHYKIHKPFIKHKIYNWIENCN